MGDKKLKKYRVECCICDWFSTTMEEKERYATRTLDERIMNHLLEKHDDVIVESFKNGHIEIKKDTNSDDRRNEGDTGE